MTSLTSGMRIEVVTVYAETSGTAADVTVAEWRRAVMTSAPGSRPGNEFEPDQDHRCLSLHDGWTCTARAGHEGWHMGWYAPGERGDEATWPNEDGRRGNEYEPDASIQCRDRMDSHPAVVDARRGRHTGYVCTARKGHDGCHAGWKWDGSREDDAEW